jgi:hypothetical protein
LRREGFPQNLNCLQYCGSVQILKSQLSESGSQRYRTCLAAWKKDSDAAYIRKLLGKSMDWLTHALEPNNLPAAALSAINLADPNSPLFGDDVDKPCFLTIIPETLLLREHLQLADRSSGTLDSEADGASAGVVGPASAADPAAASAASPGCGFLYLGFRPTFMGDWPLRA